MFDTSQVKPRTPTFCHNTISADTFVAIRQSLSYQYRITRHYHSDPSAAETLTASDISKFTHTRGQLLNITKRSESNSLIFYLVTDIHIQGPAQGRAEVRYHKYAKGKGSSIVLLRFELRTSSELQMRICEGSVINHYTTKLFSIDGCCSLY